MIDHAERLKRKREAMRRKRETARIARLAKKNPAGALDLAYQRLQILMAEHTAGNVAPMPLAFALEQTTEGPKWTLDMHVRIPRVTEYSLYAEHESLPDAIAALARQLHGQTGIRAAAEADNRRFQVAV